MAERAVLAYSGGLDTSVAVKWLKERYGYDVVTFTVDIGNVPNLDAIRQKALKAGAVDAVVTDAREEFLSDFVFPSLKADAVYEGEYPLATAIGRPLIAKLLVEVARQKGAVAVAHGCTGKGNDQVRLDVGVGTLAPELKIIAPAREWGMTREQLMRYAEANSIPVPTTRKSPYSIDENLWGRSIETGVLEDPWREPPADVYLWTRDPADTPAKAAYVEIEFEQGVPVAVDGKRMGAIDLVTALHALAGEHGVGRVDHVENRLVGIKSREIYEAPAATVLLKAHAALQNLVLTKDQLRFKSMVATRYADLIYNGLWFSGLRHNLVAFVESTQEYVNGTVRIKLFKGTCTVVGRKSPHSLYDISLATYDKGDTFNQADSPGFIRLWGLPSRLQARAQEGILTED
ncbi:MAG: argininosuccinate synthase [Dehalococcoidia bacterium]|jgi:argininosuccinate synthase|nr:argininosuccinate synthase [Dehalococcoidia bacterium]